MPSTRVWAARDTERPERSVITEAATTRAPATPRGTRAMTAGEASATTRPDSATTGKRTPDRTPSFFASSKLDTPSSATSSAVRAYDSVPDRSCARSTMSPGATPRSPGASTTPAIFAAPAIPAVNTSVGVAHVCTGRRAVGGFVVFTRRVASSTGDSCVVGEGTKAAAPSLHQVISPRARSRAARAA
jgi:hypothetical protein